MISIVIPCLNEEEGLPALFEELEASFKARPEYRYEVIAVVYDEGGLLRYHHLDVEESQQQQCWAFLRGCWPARVAM